MTKNGDLSIEICDKFHSNVSLLEFYSQGKSPTMNGAAAVIVYRFDILQTGHCVLL